MTEAEWLACTDPMMMLAYLKGKAGERKLRLLACACCRHIWHLLIDERSRKAIEIAELYAEGKANQKELDMAYEIGFSAATAVPIAESSREVQARADSASAAFAATCWVDDENFWESFRWAADASSEPSAISFQAALMGDIFGNPFRSIATNPSWLSPTVLALTVATYDDRRLPSGLLDNDCLAVLADALEEAGCTNANILNHCRQPGPHVRGCWAVDLLLGKE